MTVDFSVVDFFGSERKKKVTKIQKSIACIFSRAWICGRGWTDEPGVVALYLQGPDQLSTSLASVEVDPGLDLSTAFAVGGAESIKWIRPRRPNVPQAHTDKTTQEHRNFDLVNVFHQQPAALGFRVIG